MHGSTVLLAIVFLLIGVPALAETSATQPHRSTRVALKNNLWHINGQITAKGSLAEGLLMNVRMVNCVFEDRSGKRPDFDPDKNTAAFIKAMPEYVDWGVSAFTICLQGGKPLYDGYDNNAFTAEGELRPAYMARVEKVIDAADQRGAVIILTCYYKAQDERLKNDAAVTAGVKNTALWVKQKGYTNVLLEIANEMLAKDYDHKSLSTPEGIVSLIKLAHEAHPGLLVSSSDQGKVKFPDAVGEAVDFVLTHFNTTSLADMPGQIAALRKYGKAIVCNEDSKIGEEGAKAAALCVKEHVSWGLMRHAVNQAYPFRFEGIKDDAAVYAKIRELTTPTK